MPHGKLGALPRDLTKFMPRLENYISGPIRATGLPPANGDVDRASLVTSWPMYLNGPDTAANMALIPGSPSGIGDCTCAAFGHVIQSWTRYAGTEVTVPASSVLKAYVAVTGMEGGAYDPQTGENDNGCDPGDVLSYMKNTGMADSSGKVHKVAGYAAFGDPTDEELLAQVLNTFGNVYVAINFPDSAMSQFDDGEPWSVVQGSPIDGGHIDRPPAALSRRCGHPEVHLLGSGPADDPGLPEGVRDRRLCGGLRGLDHGQRHVYRGAEPDPAPERHAVRPVGPPSPIERLTEVPGSRCLPLLKGW